MSIDQTYQGLVAAYIATGSSPEDAHRLAIDAMADHGPTVEEARKELKK